MLSSGLLKQINDLKNSIKESINYFDVNYKGIDEKNAQTLLKKFKVFPVDSV
jgi:hypothetical protein